MSATPPVNVPNESGLDEFLSPGYARKIVPFLKEHFQQMEFVITTHSCDLVAGAKTIA